MKARIEHLTSSSHGTVLGEPQSGPLSPTKEIDLQSAKHLASPNMLVKAAITISPSDSVRSEMVDYPEVSPHESGSFASSNQVYYLLTMAQTLAKKNLPSKALEYYSRALRIENKAATTSDTDRLLMSDILFAIGGIHLSLDDPVRALYTFDLCLSIRRQLLKWDDERNAVVLRQQVRIYNMVDDSESAVRGLEELLGILCCRGANVQLLRDCWLELGRHQDRLGMHTEANSSRDEAQRLM